MVISRELQHLWCGDRANSRVESLPTLSLPPFSDVCLHELGKREHHLASICNNKERKNKEKLLLSIINFITQESCLSSNRKPVEVMNPFTRARTLKMINLITTLDMVCKVISITVTQLFTWTNPMGKKPSQYIELSPKG